MKRLAWRSKRNGVTGHGQPLPAHIIEEWVKWANAKWPTIEHWAEDVA